MVAQNNGRGDRLYVIDGRGESTELWEYDPGAAAWSPKADASIDGQSVDIRGGSAVACRSSSDAGQVGDGPQVNETSRTTEGKERSPT